MPPKFTDKRGRNQERLKPDASPSPSPSVKPSSDAKIIQANADGSIKQEQSQDPSKSDVLLLTPFKDGTCVKMLARPWMGNPDAKPEGYDHNPQFLIVNSAGDQLAVARNGQVANLICDGVNILFAAQEQADQAAHALTAEAKDLTDSIMAANLPAKK